MEKQVLLDMIVRKKYKDYRDATADLQPADLARLLDQMDANNRLVAFRLLQKDVATEAFAYMDPDIRVDMVEGFTDTELMSALERMSLDDAADLLEDMPASVVKRVLAKSERETRDSLNRLLHYPEDSAGSIMTTEYVSLKPSQDVDGALRTIRQVGDKAETVYTCFVVEKSKLIGVVSAKELLLSEPQVLISDLMDDNVITCKVTDDQEFVSREMQRYGFMTMPVVDNEGMMLGIVTMDDAVDVLTEESTEDMQKMAAILPDEDAGSYFNTSIWMHAKQRIPWLLILMLSATFTGMVTERYEAAFTALPLLVSFMPMLMDTGGNCGNQSSTLMVRGLALGEVSTGDFLKVLRKELGVALVVGAVLGIVNGARIFIMYHNKYPNDILNYVLVVSISLFGAIMLAKFVGGMLPLLAKRLGADPAIMATPFITTIVDAGALLIYFNLAGIFFGLTVH